MQQSEENTRPAASTKIAERPVDVLRIFSRPHEFGAIEADWRALELCVPQSLYFTSFDWCESWWNWFGRDSGRGLAIVAVYAGDELQAVLPLTTAKIWFFTSARLMGDETGQYADCLVHPARRGDPTLARTVVSGLKRLGLDRLTLTNCRDDSALIELLGHVRGGRDWTRSAEYSNVEINPGDYEGIEAYRNSRSSSLRKGLRRRRRKFSELGTVRYQCIGNPEDFRQVAEQIVKFKLDWLKAHGLHGRFLARTGLDGWMADVMGRAHKHGALHMSVMCADGQICAAQMAFQTPTKIVGYFSAFDISHSRNAVGKLHLEDLIDDVFEHDQVLDLMPPSDAYKCEWGVEVMNVAAYTVPLTSLGAAISQFYNVKSRALAKSAYLRLPEGVRAGTAAALLGRLRRIRRALAGSSEPVSPPKSLPLVANPQKD